MKDDRFKCKTCQGLFVEKDRAVDDVDECWHCAQTRDLEGPRGRGTPPWAEDEPFKNKYNNEDW